MPRCAVLGCARAASGNLCGTVEPLLEHSAPHSAGACPGSHGALPLKTRTSLPCAAAPRAGIRPSSLRDAAPFEEVQRQVADLLKGRIVVGHAIANDLEVRAGSAGSALVCFREGIGRNKRGLLTLLLSRPLPLPCPAPRRCC